MALIKLPMKSLGSFVGFDVAHSGESETVVTLYGVDVSYDSTNEQVTVLDV